MFEFQNYKVFYLRGGILEFQNYNVTYFISKLFCIFSMNVVLS